MENVNTAGSGWTRVVAILAVSLLGFLIIGPMIGFFLATLFFDGSFLEFADAIASPSNHPEVKLPFFIMQGCATFLGLFVFPALHARAVYGIRLRDLFAKGNTSTSTYLLTVAIVIFFMGFNSVVIEWNANLSFPDFMAGFERWARQYETAAERLTTFLTQFNSPQEFLLGLIVIAVFAAVGEELVFRGLLQPALHRASGNIHVAIWISAIVFSFIHMQFFGFFPRLLLGALFGYLYYWSGNLGIAVTAHFVNNAFAVVALYLVQLNMIDMDVKSTDSAPLPVVISFTLISIVLLYQFKRRFYDSNRSQLDQRA